MNKCKSFKQTFRIWENLLEARSSREPFLVSCGVQLQSEATWNSSSWKRVHFRNLTLNLNWSHTSGFVHTKRQRQRCHQWARFEWILHFFWSTMTWTKSSMLSSSSSRVNSSIGNYRTHLSARHTVKQWKRPSVTTMFQCFPRFQLVVVKQFVRSFSRLLIF